MDFVNAQIEAIMTNIIKFCSAATQLEVILQPAYEPIPIWYKIST